MASFRRNSEGGNSDLFSTPKYLSDTESKVAEVPKPSTMPDSEEDDLLTRLKRQVRSDRKALLELSMELEEERSASAVAAKNAMAMITRLQADKAAFQMEALQYQRMMEEQAEYDQEAMHRMKDLLFKQEEEIMSLEFELEELREKLRDINKIDNSSSSDH